MLDSMSKFMRYELSSCKIAYQLRWSLALFLTSPMNTPVDWIPELSDVCEPDGIRVLEGTCSDHRTLFLLLSTKPDVKPAFIVQRVKGRLQHLLRDRGGIQWQRNFRLSTVGDANVETVNEYVANQLQHHTMASPTSQSVLANAAWHDPMVVLEDPITSSHGQYVLGLHGVLVHAERWRTANPEFVDRTQQATLSALRAIGCDVSRIAVLSDHLHFSVRIRYDVSPAEIMLLAMNRVCESHNGMRIWMEGFYAGTIGSYDMNAVRLKSH
jgi:REP element-mobilizing transposase RayT